MDKLRDIMSTDMVTVGQQDQIQQVAKKMKDHDIGFIPVVEGENLIGVITDRDLVIRGYAENRQASETIEQVISRDIESVSPDMSVDEAAKKMAANKVRRLPVVENGKLIGVVAIGDLAVRSMHDEKAGEALSEISERK